MDRRIQEDGTVIVSGQVVPTGGAQPTIASVVSYSGNAGLQSTNVEGALDELDNEKAPLTHTHDDRYFTEVEVTNLLAGKSDTSHNHDTRYYTESEVDAKIVVLNNAIAGKSDVGHNHDDRYYTEAEVNQKIAEALGSLDAHENPSFDLVEMSTDGPGSDVVTARPYPLSWSNFWANGSGAARPTVEADPNTTRLGSGYSMKVVLPDVSSGQSIDSTIFAVSPGAVISVEAWVRGTGPYALLTLWTNQDKNPGYFQSGNAGVDSTYIKATTTWTRLQAAFTVPAGHNRAVLLLRTYADGLLGSTPGTIWWDDTKSKVQVFPPSGVVTGEIKMWPSASAPSGYLMCNGGTFSSVDYPALASLLGDTFGTHSGTTYYLPDFRGRSPVGVGSAVPAVGGNTYAMGQKWGDERMQQHNHGVSDPGHGHTFSGGRAVTWAAVNGVATDIWFDTYASGGRAPGNMLEMGSWWNTVQGAYTGVTIQNSGSGNAQNVHPVLGINYIIKAA